jgi:phenylalanyl-tRNA synthetase beta chain
MIYSRKLLEKYLPGISSKTNDDLISACGQIGVEIEHIYHHPKLTNFVIGKILSHEKHPNADRLNVCKVKISDTQTNTIICGAQNVTDNMFVIVALENAKIHDGREIQYKEIKGIKSEGMLCAYSELTPRTEFLPSSEEHNIILLDEAKIGDIDVGKYIGFDDEIYDIAIPFSNRPDFNGVLALCQELAGFFKIDFELPKFDTECKDTKKLDIKILSNIECFTLAKIENVDCKKKSD